MVTINQIIEDLMEIKQDRENVYELIAELYDKIEDWEAETEYILEKLAEIQSYAK